MHSAYPARGDCIVDLAEQPGSFFPPGRDQGNGLKKKLWRRQSSPPLSSPWHFLFCFILCFRFPSGSGDLGLPPCPFSLPPSPRTTPTTTLLWNRRWSPDIGCLNSCLSRSTARRGRGWGGVGRIRDGTFRGAHPFEHVPLELWDAWELVAPSKSTVVSGWRL